MDQTAIQTEPLAKPVETAVQSGTPGVGREPQPAPEPKTPAVQVLSYLADLRITVFLFALSMLLVFWGTLAQVDNGVWTVVNNYFRSVFVWVPLKVVLFNSMEQPGPSIPFPGGWLIGGAMFVNLLAAHAIRFKLAWNRTGIILTHAGIIIMMVGEFVTGIYAIEGSMPIKVGESSNAVIDGRSAELAIIRRLDDKKDEVVAIPSSLLIKDTTIEHPDVPFKIYVNEYMANCELRNVPGNHRSNKGFGKVHVAKPMPEISGVDPNQKFDMPALEAKLMDQKGKELGRWLFSTHFGDQWIEHEGKKYQVSLRYKHTQRDFTIRLDRFDHKLFPGTNTPKDFRSYVHISDPAENVERDIEIFMNNPLYYRGETFYQSSWSEDAFGRADGTVLQVVRNPGWLLPYISCGVVGFGLLIHFGLTLYRFAERRMNR